MFNNYTVKCNGLVFDEIKIWSGLIYLKNTGKILDFVFGELLKKI